MLRDIAKKEEWFKRSEKNEKKVKASQRRQEYYLKFNVTIFLLWKSSGYSNTSVSFTSIQRSMDNWKKLRQEKIKTKGKTKLILTLQQNIYSAGDYSKRSVTSTV